MAVGLPDANNIALFLCKKRVFFYERANHLERMGRKATEPKPPGGRGMVVRLPKLLFCSIIFICFSIFSKTVFSENIKGSDPEQTVYWDKTSPDFIRAEKALYYILYQQVKDTGLFQSYKNEETAHTFDQALVIIDLVMEMEILNPHLQRYQALEPRCRKLVHAIIKLQNPDGSWFNAYNAFNGKVLSKEKYTGVVSWIVFALYRYGVLMHDEKAINAAYNGNKYLKSQIISGGLIHTYPNGDQIAITEANLDGWFALAITGDTKAANALKNFILNNLWSEDEGRFFAGKNIDNGRIDKTPYLDNQTLGAHFLKQIGRPNDAYKALYFAHDSFKVEHKGQALGLDGRTSTLAVWLGGTCQYITAKGPYAQMFLDKLNNYQKSSGGFPHDTMNIRNPWHSTQTGISSTVWAHQANLGTHPLAMNRIKNTGTQLAKK